VSRKVREAASLDARSRSQRTGRTAEYAQRKRVQFPGEIGATSFFQLAVSHDYAAQAVGFELECQASAAVLSTGAGAAIGQRLPW
jgi:hypothetical protein